MERYRWPGNVRQLINAVERAKILSEGHVITVKDLPKELSPNTGTTVEAQQPAIDIYSTDDLAAIQRARWWRSCGVKEETSRGRLGR